MGTQTCHGAAPGGPGSSGIKANWQTGAWVWLRVSWERLQYRRTEDPLVDGDVDVSRNQKESEQQVATLEGWGPAGIWNEKVKTAWE